MALRVGATLLLTAACLAWVLSGVDLGAAWQTLRGMGWGWMLGVQALYLAAHALRVARFRLLLDQEDARKTTFGGLFSIVSVGYLAIHVVPFRMGEFVRPWLLREKAGVELGAGLAAIVVERILDMVMLLAMLLVVGLVVDLPSGVVIQGIDVLRAGQRVAGVLVGAGVMTLTALAMAGERLLVRTDRLPGGHLVRHFVRATRTLVANPVRGGAALALSILIWALTIEAVRQSMAAFPGLPSDALAALTTWALTLAGMTAVPTPGFFGGYEAACTTILGLLKVEPTPAGAFAFLLHVGQFGFTLVLGIGCLVREGLDLRSIVAASRDAVRTSPAP